MDAEDVLQWVESLIAQKTGEPLTPIQEAIITGVWQRQKYPQIAKDFNCSTSYVKKEAAKLWEKLGEELGEDLNKFNFRSKLEKRHRVSQSTQGDCLLQQIDINIGGQLIQTITATPTPPSPSPPNSTQQPKSPSIDLTEAPELIDYSPEYRQAELTTLKQWIFAPNRLITIYGLTGIGKSQLAVKLIPEIQSEFDYIIWRSLSNAPTFSTLQTELKQFFAPSQPTPLPTVIDYFRSARCLVILDDVENIFQPHQLAGHYLPEYQEYGKLFKQVATSSHQSCLILLSWEKPREFTALEGETGSRRTLHLQGIGKQAAEMFRAKGLTDEARWSELINLYQGHPAWLNIIAATIRELCNGSVAEFLEDTDNIFLGDLEPLLSCHLERLSDVEIKVSQWLASENEAVDISQPPNNHDLSKSDLWQAIQSLGRRGLVEKVALGAKVKFRINPVFQQYIRSKFD